MGLGGFALQPSLLFANEYSVQLELIDALGYFLRTYLSMDLKEEFYTKWRVVREHKSVDDRLVYLIVSRADEITTAVVGRFQYFGTRESEALEKESRLKSIGYHTLLYKSAGSSATRLNNRLLSYPLETIAFVVIHEAMHQHMRLVKSKVHQAIYEAAADVVANYGVLKFAEDNKLISDKAARRQLHLHEKIHKVISEQLKEVRTALPDTASPVYQQTEKRIIKLVSRGNQFNKDRYNYEVNNAYYLHHSLYSEHYFLLKSLAKKLYDLSFFVKYISRLPGGLDKEISEIRTKIAE